MNGKLKVHSSSNSLNIILLSLFILFRNISSTSEDQRNKTSNEIKRVCRGTSSAFGINEKTKERYDQYRSHYNECTHVDGNLEIVFLDSPSTYDLSFLESIQEVTGYVLLVGNHADFVPLRNLRVIRGDSLFQHESKMYALYVAINYDPRGNQGLKELQFNSLREILSGSVFIFANNQLCFENTINWKDIITGRDAMFVYQARDHEKPSRICQECHDHCKRDGQKRCWGSGPDMCQKIKSFECSPQCDGHCFGSLPNQCCHPECAGGCDGPTDRDCWSCRHFNDEGSCKIHCPPQFVYSHSDFKQVPNPNAKFANGNLCVQKCPPHLIIDSGACVQDCGPGRGLGRGGMCEECNGACPKTCKVDLIDDFVHMGNIEMYRGCTIVQGRIKILDATFIGDPYNKIGPMQLEALSAFEDVQEVTEFIQIQANNTSFKDLSFFKKLKIIHGRKLDRGRASLQISQTSLEWLGLISLKEIRNGGVLIANNTHLCHVDLIDWSKFFHHGLQNAYVSYNENPLECELLRELCHNECGMGGCWGKNDDQCISCKSFEFDGRCVPSCSIEVGLYQESSSKCGKCHNQCKNGCYGEGSDRCKECKTYLDGPYCVGKCPPFKYPDENGICQLCHPDCDVQFGCSGPGNHMGHNGCRACKLHHPIDSQTNNNSKSIFTCIPLAKGCSQGYYKLYTAFNSLFVSSHKRKKFFGYFHVCTKCHPQCVDCYGAGPSFCKACLKFSHEGKCVDKCQDDHYPDKSSVCQKCDSKCLTCSGHAWKCTTCKHYMVPLHIGSQYNFTCVEDCPETLPYKIAKRNSRGELESFCSHQIETFVNQNNWTFFAIFPSLILITLGLAVMFVTKKKKSLKKQQNKLIRGVTSFEPVAPSNIQPDMSTLTLIRQSELRIGGVIGTGAFGTVYQGLWIPENKKLESKVLVAIKVLMEEREDSGSKEILDEARIMASVDHSCCVKILCLCLSPCIMLVTDLMRLGCMLDFIRTRGHLLGSSTIVLWSWQIAQGMKFLQEKGIVHRDLAARNVLIQSLKQVKITDFGLAKLLNFDKGPLNPPKSQTRMPIKWLAYESIVSQIFTHQSDVWSFGVTLWELLSFGRKPYGWINAMETIAFIEKGNRLSRPDICLSELYDLLLKCWLFEARERPTFDELNDRFEQMNSSPEKYVALPLKGPCDESSCQDEGYKSLSHSDNSIAGEHDFTQVRLSLYVNDEKHRPLYINSMHGIVDECEIRYSNFTGHPERQRRSYMDIRSTVTYCNSLVHQNRPSSNYLQFARNSVDELNNISKGEICCDCNVSRNTSLSESTVFEDIPE